MSQETQNSISALFYKKILMRGSYKMDESNMF